VWRDLDGSNLGGRAVIQVTTIAEEWRGAIDRFLTNPLYLVPRSGQKARRDT